MRCDVDPDKVSAGQSDNDKDIEQVIANGRSSVLPLGGRATSLDHVLSDAGDLKAELEQLAMNARAPHSRLSRLIRRISARRSASSCGRPPRERDFQRQYRRKPARCQRRSGGKEVSGQLVVARGDAPPVFDAAEVVFDLVASSLKALGTIGFSGGIAAARDDRQCAFILDLLTYLLAVVGLVGRNGQWRLGSVEHVADDLAVMDLATRDGEVQRAALAIDNGVDFRGATAAADADRLILLPL
jgi:hypothetical protein